MSRRPSSYCFESKDGACLFVCPTGTGHIGAVTTAADGSAGPRIYMTPDECDELASRLRDFAKLTRAGRPGAPSKRRELRESKGAP